MNNIKLFVYRLLHGYHFDMCIQYTDWIEDANLAGDHKEVVYCCARYDEHRAKSDKYYAKMMEIKNQRKGA